MNQLLLALTGCLHVALLYALPAVPIAKTDLSKVDLNVLRRQTRSTDGQIGCMHMASTAGELSYVADGTNSEVCGLYLIGQPNDLVEIAFMDFNVQCQSGSVLAVFDGWELQGELFPGADEHPLPMSKRYSMYCDSESVPHKVIITSQNVALIQFKIPAAGEGFKVMVNFKPNPQPCNAVAMFDMGVLTMKNYGHRRNCTTSIIYPEQIHLISVDVGVTSDASVLEAEVGLTDKCMNFAGGDYIQLLNGNGLDTSLMRSKGILCGMDSNSESSVKFTLGCQHSVVRMVSSGEYHNTVTFQYAPPPAGETSDATC